MPGMPRAGRSPILAVMGILVVAIIGCLPAASPGASPARTSAPAASERSAPPSSRALTVNPRKATVGDQITVTASGLPPGKTVELVWQTVDGRWVIEENYFFRGRKFSEASWSLGRYPVSDQGLLDAVFTMPEDYGGVHNVVARLDGAPIAQGAVDLTQSFEMSPREGPVGTSIELRARGLGWQTMENTWVVNWNNHGVGWVSAVETRGTATARFRATGPVGDNEVKVYTGYMGQSYLNHEQAPTAYLPRPRFTFRTTAGGTVDPAYAETYPRQPVFPSLSTIGASLAITPTQGPVGTPASLTGSGFPAGETLALIWKTMVGSRVTDAGFEPRELPLGSVSVAPDGSLAIPLTVPDDLGGLHTLSLRAGDTVVAETSFTVETSIIGISPSSGPVGTPVAIHLKGVGWTEYDNIYVVNYDNAYMGYACGFNSNGDVVINFTAAGAPGVHLIDLYPGVYQGPKEGQQLYRLPQLTYAEDHPGNKIPALRFAFVVTGR
ncbi:MAG: hypothetical protein IT307_10560 [Chloroflexi bacterium]|nr:hypothetical protein [Chloroflexota bacterium]